MSIKINRVYTRSGDNGTTALVGGKRVSKANLRVEAYGEVDELNAALGLVQEFINSATAEPTPIVQTLQQQLFDIGAELASAADLKSGTYHVQAGTVTALEALCDRFAEGLPELSSFLLPGGSKLAATLHIARTTCRRAERAACRLSEAEMVNPALLKYLNRLSDLLFILCRYALKKEGKSEVLWLQAQERK